SATPVTASRCSRRLSSRKKPASARPAASTHRGSRDSTALIGSIRLWGDAVAGRNRSAGDDLRIDAAVAMAEAAQQGFGNCQIADARTRINVRRRTAYDALHHPQPCRWSDRKVLVEQFELSPRRPPLDIDVAAEPERVDRRAEDSRELCDRRHIDDRHDLACNVGEAVAGRMQD